MYNFPISGNLLGYFSMAVTRLTAAVAQELANGARDVLNQGAAVVTGTQGDYIANGQPESIYGKLQQATARQYCRRYADNPDQYTGRAKVLAENACRPYLDDIGYGSPGSIRKPFTGGQCPVRYFVQATWQNRNTSGELGAVQNQNVTSPLGRPGPIVSLRREGVPGSWQLVLTHGTDALFTEPRSVVRSSTSTNSSFENITITGFTRVDGQPDNCGDPPPDITAPTPPPAPGPRKEPFSPSPDINVDIDLVINPDLTVNVDFGVGPITIDPFGDGGEGEPGGGGGDPGDPTDPGSPGAGGATGNGGEAAGEAPEGQELVGLLVTVTEAPGDANRFGNNSKQPFRGIGYVRMGYPGRLGLDISGGTVISPQFFHAAQRGLTNWSVAANIGFNLTVVPYYRSIEP